MTHDNSPPFDKMSTLVDSFSGSLSDSKWHVYPRNDITEGVGGRLRFYNNSTEISYSRMDTTHIYDLDSASVRCEAGTSPRYWQFSTIGIDAAQPDAGYRPELVFTIDNGSINATVRNWQVDYLDGDVQVSSTRPYDPVSMAYLRTIRVSQDVSKPVFNMQYSPDGASWQTLVSFNARGPSMAPISGWRVEFWADAGVIYMSNFNGTGRMKIRTASGTWVGAGGARIRGADGTWRSAGGSLKMRSADGTWASV